MDGKVAAAGKDLPACICDWLSCRFCFRRLFIVETTAAIVVGKYVSVIVRLLFRISNQNKRGLERESFQSEYS